MMLSDFALTFSRNRASISMLDRLAFGERMPLSPTEPLMNKTFHLGIITVRIFQIEFLHWCSKYIDQPFE